MFRSFAARGFFVLVLLLANFGFAQVKSWDAARDFSGAQNPNAAWTYGWKPSIAGGLTPFPNYEQSLATLPGRDAWQDLSRSSLLGVYHNSVGATGDIPTNMLLLQPDATGDLAVIEWTAPANMAVNIQGMFQTQDTTAAQVKIVSSVGGTRFSGTVSNTTTTTSFGLFLNVTAGQTLDFTVSGGAAGLNLVISNLMLVGNSSIQNISATDTRLRLNPSLNDQVGGAWTLTKQRFDDGFDTTFLFQISQLVNGGADGFAFVIQNSSPTVLGGGGGGFGFDGIPSSLAIEFDTFLNASVGDPNNNHISVQTLGVNPNSAKENVASIGESTQIPNLKDGNWHLVHVHYAVRPTAQLSIYFDNINTPALVVAVDIVSKLQLPDGTAWVGLTGATGGATEVHDIQNWHFFSYDLHPPVLNLPANMTVEGNVLNGAIVHYTVSAVDTVDGPRPISCTPSSGGVFAVGNTTVNCSSTDLSGNTANGSFVITVTDTTAPNVVAPLSVTAAAVNSSGATVSYIATADDIVDGAIVPNCFPASGSMFPLGTTTVTCTAKDKAGNIASQSFPLTVADETLPVISGLVDIQLEATGLTTTVSWPGVTATDNVDGTVPVLCTPASGSQFAVGSVTVQCKATDAAGNTAAGSFVVTVKDTTPPLISNLPSSITAEATSASGAVVTWSGPTANDLVGGTVAVICAPSSGSVFPLGSTTVSCSATDGHGNSSSGKFTVMVRDTTPPVISGLPSNLILEATAPSGAIATWTSPTASDVVDGSVPVNCLPASGSTFALGTSSIGCSASDARGNTSTKQFSVTVQDTTPPVISNLPADLTLVASSSSGGVATWSSPIATDLVDGTVSVTCLPASGSVFPVGTTAVGCSATDAHHNISAKNFTVTVQSPLPPVVSCGKPDGVWHASDIAIVCTANGGGSSLVNIANESFVLTTNVPVGSENANAATNSVTVCNVAGKCTTAGPIFGLKVDKRAPQISITTPANATYALHQPVATFYSCADGGSGLATCSGTVANGAALDTASVGAKQFTVNAGDNVGNASSASVSYSVGYSVCVLGHSEPKHEDSDIPVRLELCDYNGRNVSSPSVEVFAVAVVGANGNMPMMAAGHANPGLRFRYVGDRDRGAYIFNLKTKGFAAGTYQLLVKVGGDPTLHTLTFQVRGGRENEGRDGHK